MFFVFYASLVLDLSELSGAFIVHLALQLSANITVAFADLSEDVGLVVLSGQGVGQLLLRESVVLSVDFSVQVLLLVVGVPQGLVC